MKTLYLLRHGETICNRERRFYGSLESELTDQGRKQARQQRKLMESFEPEVIYTSGLKRAQETATIAFPKRELLKRDVFNEKGFGLWEGLTADEIEDRDPVNWVRWLEAPFDYCPPQAESFIDFKTRVQSGLVEILAREEATIVLVAHLGVLRLLIQNLTDPHRSFWDIEVPQGRVLVLEESLVGWREKLL